MTDLRKRYTAAFGRLRPVASSRQPRLGPATAFQKLDGRHRPSAAGQDFIAKGSKAATAAGHGTLDEML